MTSGGACRGQSHGPCRGSPHPERNRGIPRICSGRQEGTRRRVWDRGRSHDTSRAPSQWGKYRKIRTTSTNTRACAAFSVIRYRSVTVGMRTSAGAQHCLRRVRGMLRLMKLHSATRLLLLLRPYLTHYGWSIPSATEAKRPAMLPGIKN